MQITGYYNLVEKFTDLTNLHSMLINGEDSKISKIILIIYLYMLLVTNLGLRKKVISTSFIKLVIQGHFNCMSIHIAFTKSAIVLEVSLTHWLE